MQSSISLLQSISCRQWYALSISQQHRQQRCFSFLNFISGFRLYGLVPFHSQNPEWKFCSSKKSWESNFGAIQLISSLVCSQRSGWGSTVSPGLRIWAVPETDARDLGNFWDKANSCQKLLQLILQCPGMSTPKFPGVITAIEETEHHCTWISN